MTKFVTTLLSKPVGGFGGVGLCRAAVQVAAEAATKLPTLTPDDEAYLAFRAAGYRQELEEMIERHHATKAEVAAQFDGWLVALGFSLD